MSAETGTDSSQIVNLSPEEKRLFGQLFRQADFDNVSVVTGEVAVSFFEKTRLDTRVLGKIWQIADTENRGFLTPAGFSVALRLIGHAQAGREPSPELARQSGPLPRFDGVPVPSPSPASPPPPAALQAQGSGGGPVRIPPLTPDRVAQFSGLFERQSLGPGNVLPGDQAKQIFEKSGLPNETLGLVWQLADTEQRGAFLVHEFVIAMHLLNALKTGVLKAVPNTLPPGLVEAARRGPAARQSPTHTGPITGIATMSGSANMRTGSPLARGGVAPPLTGLATGGDWLITPAEKTKFDSIYDGIQKANRGYITGEEAVPFFSQSDLSGDILAQIWDLSDINSEGHLTKDEFAIAMYLIRLQRARRDGTNVLPTTLPPNLVPPSMRNQVRPMTAGSAFDSPPQQQPPPPMPKSAVNDLFGLDTSSAPIQAPLQTGGSTASDPFGSGSVGIPPGSPLRASPPPSSKFQPFVPSSSFGRGLTQQPGASHEAQDLLGDNDPEISSKLTEETTELANISNQIGTLTTQMTNLQTQRSTAQNDLNQSSSQKKNFEQRLTQLRTMYEKEVKDVRSLEDQLTASRAETRKLQAECMSLDGTYQDLQSQRQKVLSGLQADQQENASLKEKIRALNAEIAQLKPQIEKLKSEARQQKGLVAINKKQLSTNESERDRLKSEVDDLVKDGELSRQATGSSLQSGPVAQVASPAPSTASATNPFFKRTGSTDMMGAFSSPPLKGSDKLFDDIFGGPSPSTSTPPAKQQHTGASTGSVGSFGSPPATSPSISRQATLNVDSAVPAPPESRQISSSFLPLKDVAESISSSRQVSPPLSRVGDDLGGAASPMPSVGAFPSLEPSSTGQSRTASPSETRSKVSEDLSNGSTAPPDAPAGSGTETTPTAPAERSTVRDSDPFAAMDHEKAKADFDNAFASFTKIHKNPDKAPTAENNSNAFSSFNTEFPPISELERDEDSDSDSEPGGGFDDDFAPSSPKVKKENTEVKKEAGLPAGDKVDAKPLDTAVTEKLAGVESGVKNSNPDNADDIFGSAVSVTPTAKSPAIQSSAPTLPSKTPFDDDLDDDFEGLEDAKEGSADDDFANISRSGLDDFSSVFDSPQTSQMKTDSTFDFGTLSTGSLPSNANANASPNAASPAAPTTTDTKADADLTPVPATKADSGDWDAMFSGLEPAGSGSPKAAEEERPGTKRAETDDDPMLKQLVGMGYSRSDGLSALEKYDYNLERAANYLASQS
ncbi:related to EDE1 protein [Cephalotrichum gorgonifer]|uniref:Related to EDE1 protein n=1 Tax=Cephalotrichum gorgonifer TaxID=2041049 RepID=A0AAE8N489_9PEZI|nr:related to EDE1 protein [Cephalotrichum gorgonifer]